MAALAEERVRVGDLVHRASYEWSPAVMDLLQHLERAGFEGAPRARGFDEAGREVLTFIEGDVARGTEFIPADGGRFDLRLPAHVWRDEVLVRLGALARVPRCGSDLPVVCRTWCFDAVVAAFDDHHVYADPAGHPFCLGRPGG